MKNVIITSFIFIFSLFFVNSSVKANTISNLRLWEGSSAYDWTSGNVGYYLPSNSFRAIEINTDVMDLSTANEYQYGFIAYLSYDNVYQSYYSSDSSWAPGYKSFPNLQQFDTGVEQYFYNSSTVSGTIKYFTFNIHYDCGSGTINCYGHGTIHFYGTTSDYQLLNYGLSTEPIIVDSTSGSIINQNNTIISQNNTLIQNQQETNDKLDDITDMDIPDSSKEDLDDSSYQDYQGAEDDLMDSVGEADLSSVDIAIDGDSSNFIWDTITDIFQSHPLIMSTVIAILSIGIIKLALGR